MPAGRLYIVATPIGNLEDITLRALRVLKEVDLIAAEDTRHSRVLLSHYDIRTPLTSYHEHNEKVKGGELIGRLKKGENIALITDAGTPAISDPGYRLVTDAVCSGVTIVPVPGASALVAALSAGGLPTDRFVFEGFLPAKRQQRRGRLSALADETRTLVFYEAPHRLADALADIGTVLGDREIVVTRELTKLHEEFLRGRVEAVARQLAGQEIKGEITLLVAGGSAPPGGEISPRQLEDEIRALRAGGLRVKEIAELLGEKYGRSKKEIYGLTLALEEERR